METPAFRTAINSRGMRAFYSWMIIEDHEGVCWKSWIMSVGTNSLNPMFCHAYLYAERDDRDEVAHYLIEKKRRFKEMVVEYYEVIKCH